MHSVYTTISARLMSLVRLVGRVLNVTPATNLPLAAGSKPSPSPAATLDEGQDQSRRTLVDPFLYREQMPRPTEPPPIVPAELDDKGLSKHEFRVFLQLSRYADRDGHVTISCPALASDCSINEDTVWAALKNLQKLGLITRNTTSGVRNRYELCVMRVPTLFPDWLDEYELDLNCLRILCHLARRRGTNPEAYTRPRNIAPFCRIRLESTKSALARLEALGLISAEERNDCVYYRLFVPLRTSPTGAAAPALGGDDTVHPPETGMAPPESGPTNPPETVGAPTGTGTPTHRKSARVKGDYPKEFKKEREWASDALPPSLALEDIKEIADSHNMTNKGVEAAWKLYRIIKLSWQKDIRGVSERDRIGMFSLALGEDKRLMKVRAANQRPRKPSPPAPAIPSKPASPDLPEPKGDWRSVACRNYPDLKDDFATIKWNALAYLIQKEIAREFEYLAREVAPSGGREAEGTDVPVAPQAMAA